jgi:hypothetical protein
MRREYGPDATEGMLDEMIWAQNDVNVMEANYEERRKIVIPPERYRFAGEIEKVQAEMWIFAEPQELEYCSVVSSPGDKGAQDTVDSLAVPPDHI